MKPRSSTVPTRKLLRSVFAALSAGTFLTFAAPAHSDTYHAVNPGETLLKIARHYNVKPDMLREANQLDSIGDNAPLSAMLLRVPSASEQPKSAQAPRPVSELKKTNPAPSTARYFGSVTRTVAYKVNSGDTFESIAAAHTRGNESVSVAELREKNRNISALRAGTVLQLPIKTTFNAPAARPTSQASAQVKPNASNSAATRSPQQTSRAIVPADQGSIQIASTKIASSGNLPVAREVPATGTPSYRAPNPRASQSRGNLSARGGYGSMVEGGRVLQTGEVLPTAAGTAARSVAAPDPAPKNLAKVAKVVLQGAQIRRLPQASAVTLYKCAPGTEIAVLKQEGEWSAVLMSDRSTGWLPTRYLQFTGTSVDVTSQVVPRTLPGNDSLQGWKGGYQSNHPAIQHALRWLGTPYRYGGQSAQGIDCSSLMQKSFAAAGIKLPRVSRDQAKVGQPVSPENLQPGDRLYFSSSGTHVDHTGLYMGNDLFVHASGGARKVVVSRLSDKRNWNIFVNARR